MVLWEYLIIFPFRHTLINHFRKLFTKYLKVINCFNSGIVQFHVQTFPKSMVNEHILTGPLELRNLEVGIQFFVIKPKHMGQIDIHN